jgi:basic amino acid/polyamine antiporter, APA family
MVEFTSPVFWFFILLIAVALIVLRFKYAHVSRPFRVPLYPILPLAFIGTCAYLLYRSLLYAQSEKAVHISLYVMAVGFGVWIVARIARNP